jgi:hypothetical protein
MKLGTRTIQLGSLSPQWYSDEKRLLQPSINMTVLHIHKATSVHKGQGISCGKGKPDELVAVVLIWLPFCGQLN